MYPNSVFFFRISTSISKRGNPFKMFSVVFKQLFSEKLKAAKESKAEKMDLSAVRKGNAGLYRNLVKGCMDAEALCPYNIFK